jgi:hypothetical protein
MCEIAHQICGCFEAIVAGTKGSNRMRFSKIEDHFAVCVTKHFIKAMVAVVLCGGAAFCLQAQDAQPKNGDQSWTATTETSDANANPARTTESHEKSGNRSVDKQRVEVLGDNGQYRPDFETETETVRVNDTTTHTVVRTYRWDGNGQRKLAEVTDEEARNAANGDGQAVRTTSSADVNGHLQVVRREVTDTSKTGADAEEAKTKVYLADGNGGFTMARQTEELKKRGDDHGVEVKKTTLLPDGNGNWKVGEVTERTVKVRTTEERVAHPDLNGRLSEVSRTVVNEKETGAGEKSKSVETYSGGVPGFGDGKVHLSQRETTMQKRDSGGEVSEEQVEQPSLGNPSDSPRVTAKTKYVVRYAASGAQQTKTVLVRDGNGSFSVVSVETRKSDQVPPAQVPKAASDKPE